MFSSVSNPTGMRIICENYAKDNGTIHYKTIKIKDEFGQWEDKKVFDYYTPNNPQELYNVKIGEKGTYSELLYNHKALLFSKEP